VILLKEIEIKTEDREAVTALVDLIGDFFDKISINTRRFNTKRLKNKILKLENYPQFINFLNKIKLKVKKEIIPKIYFFFGGHGGIIINNIGFCEFDSPQFALKSLIDKMELAIKTEMPFNIEVAISCLIWLKNNQPKEYKQFQELYHKGRFEIINPSYSQPYNLIIGEESNIKQLEFGLKTLKELGLKCNTYYASESSMHPQIPQLLKSFGIHYCSLRTRLLGINPTTPSGHIVWRGLDNSSIQTITDQSGVFNGELWHGRFFKEIPHMLFQAVSRPFFQSIIYSSIEDFVMDIPLNEEIWRVSKYLDIIGIFVTFSDLINKIELDGEYKFNRDSFYLGENVFILSELFLNNKKCEKLLLTAERVNSIISLYQKTTKDDILDNLWKRLLETQAHDNYAVPFIRNGDYSEVQLSPEVYNSLELNKNKVQISRLSLDIQKSIQEDCKRYIVEDLRKLAESFINDKPGNQIHFLIFNSSISDRENIVKIEVSSELNEKYYLINAKEEKVPFEKNHKKVKFIAKVPSLGITVYTLIKSKNSEDYDFSKKFLFDISISSEKDSLEIDFNGQSFCELKFDQNQELIFGKLKIQEDLIQKYYIVEGYLNGKRFDFEIQQNRNSNRLKINLNSVGLDEIVVKPKFSPTHSYINYPFGIEETKRNSFQSMDFVWLKGNDFGLLFIQIGSQKFMIDRDTFTLKNKLPGDGVFKFFLYPTKEDSFGKISEYVENCFFKFYGVEFKGILNTLELSNSYLRISPSLRLINLWIRNSRQYMRIFNPTIEKINFKSNGLLCSGEIKELDLNLEQKQGNRRVKPWEIKTFELL